MINKEKMKHIYLNSSDFDITKDIRYHKLFFPAYRYTHDSFANEYGKIILDEFHIHILIGNIRQKNCPWCNSTPVLVQPDKDDNSQNYCYYQCEKCGSRGPKLYISNESNKDEIDSETILDHIDLLYSTRTPWDIEIKEKNSK